MKKLFLVFAIASLVSCGERDTPKPGTAGVITTIVGIGTPGFNGDGGPATKALLQDPHGVALDATGNIYISDASNMRIRKISTDGTITTIAGNGTTSYSGNGGLAANAGVGLPRGIAVDGSGNVYFSDCYNQLVRKINTSGIISIVAGNGERGYSGDGMAATLASLNNPVGIAVDGNGNVYIADETNSRLRKVSTSGVITTIAGTGTYGYLYDDGIPATASELYKPACVATDANGDIYVAENEAHRVRKINAAGIIKTIAGNGSGYYSSGDNGPATAATFSFLTAMVFDAAGNLYLTDENKIRKITPVGAIYSVAGNGNGGYAGDDGFAVHAQLNTPTGIAVDSRGVLYIADMNNHRIRKVGK